MMIQVTNRNRKPLKGRYAGVDYEFRPHLPIEIPREAADHIFALGKKGGDKAGALNRLGLLGPNGTTMESALAALAMIKFEEGRMIYGEGLTPPGETPPPEPEKGPGEDEEEDEDEDTESGGSPGAPRSPGGKSEAEGVPPLAASDDLVWKKREPPAEGTVTPGKSRQW